MNIKNILKKAASSFSQPDSNLSILRLVLLHPVKC